MLSKNYFYQNISAGLEGVMIKKDDAEYQAGKQKVFVWKFESFIFDVLDFASKVEVLVCLRAECYAPLKNASGDKSSQSVREALALIAADGFIVGEPQLIRIEAL